jgi:hypothetical protein
MSEIDNTINDAMEIEEATENAPAIDSEALFENLTSEEPAQHETPAEESSDQQEPGPEEARKSSIQSGIQALFEDGWTAEELTAFSQDAQVRADIAAGKDVLRAANAYSRRQQVKPMAQAKRGVPTVTTAATAGVKDSNRIADMSDKEFDEFSRRATEAAMAGKKVKIK